MNVWRSKKVRRTVLIALVAILAFALMPLMNRASIKYLDNWTKKSIGTVVVASGVSSALSVIEDSEAQVSVVVAGGSLAVGDAVRPLNQMVGRVVSVALASTVSLGIQRVMVDIGASVGFKLLLLVAVVCQLVAVWVERPLLRRLANGLLVVALLATFAIPTAVLLTGRIGDQYTQGSYAKAQQRLGELDAELKDINLKKISRLGESLKSVAAAYSGFAVNYVVVFIVQTMVMPVLILWGLLKLIGYLLTPTATARMEARLLKAIRGSKKSEDGLPLTPQAAAEV